MGQKNGMNNTSNTQSFGRYNYHQIRRGVIATLRWTAIMTGSLAACAAIPAAAAWGFDIPQKHLFILLGTLMVAAANAALAIRTLVCNYERKYPQKTVPRWADWLTRKTHQDHQGCPRNAPGHARHPQTTGPTDTTQ